MFKHIRHLIGPEFVIVNQYNRFRDLSFLLQLL